jgi:transposase
VIEDMIRTWAPDNFWAVAQPLIPVPPARPQGGGKRRADDRAVLAAIVYLVQAGCSWPKLPAVLFGISRATAHRRFTEWTNAGCGSGCTRRSCTAWRDRRDRLVAGGGGLDRGTGGKGGSETGPNPVDRGKPGSKIHVLCDRHGLPLTVLISAANTHDSQLLVPLLDSIAPIRTRRGRPRRKPIKLHADKAYDQPALRREVRRCGIIHRQRHPHLEQVAPGHTSAPDTEQVRGHLHGTVAAACAHEPGDPVEVGQIRLPPVVDIAAVQPGGQSPGPRQVHGRIELRIVIAPHAHRLRSAPLRSRPAHPRRLRL